MSTEAPDRIAGLLELVAQLAITAVSFSFEPRNHLRRGLGRWYCRVNWPH